MPRVWFASDRDAHLNADTFLTALFSLMDYATITPTLSTFHRRTLRRAAGCPRTCLLPTRILPAAARAPPHSATRCLYLYRCSTIPRTRHLPAAACRLAAYALHLITPPPTSLPALPAACLPTACSCAAGCGFSPHCTARLPPPLSAVPHARRTRTAHRLLASHHLSFRYRAATYPSHLPTCPAPPLHRTHARAAPTRLHPRTTRTHSPRAHSCARRFTPA